MKDLFTPFDGELGTIESLEGTQSRLWLIGERLVFGWLDLDDEVEINNKGVVFETSINEFTSSLLAYSIDASNIAEVVRDELVPMGKFEDMDCPDSECDGTVIKHHPTNMTVSFMCGECGISGPWVNFGSSLTPESIKEAQEGFNRVFNIKQVNKDAWGWKE